MNSTNEECCIDCCNPKRPAINEDEEVCECGKCEECGVYVGDTLIIHDFGCVGLCEGCSIEDGEPHCPKGKEGKDCDWCRNEWRQISKKNRKERKQ